MSNKKESNITFDIRDIDPQWAGEILDRHFERITEGKFLQRSVSKATVNKYAMDISMDAFRLIPDPIVFDTDDNLLNGQHRLEAIRRTGKTVRMVVSTGWPVDNNGDVKLIDLMDGNKPRTIDQMLHLHGLVAARNYTTTCRFIARIAHVVGRAPSVTFSSVQWMLDTLNLRVAIDKIMSNATDHRDFQGRNVGGLAYYYTAYPRKAMEFADSLFNGTAKKGDAVWSYMNWLKQHPRFHTDNGLKALAACIRAWHNNTELTQVRVKQDDLNWLSNINPKLRETIKGVVPQK